MPVALLAHDPELLVLVGVAERGLQEEAVELRLGQRERAFVLDRVLGREQEEGRRELARDAVDRHLPLGHRLEQRRLRLRHRAVDLVDEHDVREDRPGPELEVARLLVVDREPGDVGRLQVGRALDAGRPRPRRSARSRAPAPSSPCRGRPRRARGRRTRARRARAGSPRACRGRPSRRWRAGVRDVDGAFEPDADRLLVDPWRCHSRHPRARMPPDLS